MSKRCIIRNILLVAASLAVIAWPSISKATVLAGGVVNWDSTATSQPGIFIPSVQYPVESGALTQVQMNAGGLASWDTAAAMGIGGPAVTSPGLFVPSSQPTYTGTLNMTNNIVIIQTDSAVAAAAAYQNLYYMAESAYDGNNVQGNISGPGSWTGQGLTSSYAAAEFAQYLPTTGIAMAINDSHGNNTGTQNNDPDYSVFDGVKVNSNSLLLMYTYIGDTTFKGYVTGDDINNVITGYEAGQYDVPGYSGSANGEFDYNGGITSSNDVNNAITAYEAQGYDEYPPQEPGSTPTQPVVAFGGQVAVPEPSTALTCLIGAVGLLAGFACRRRSALHLL